MSKITPTIRSTSLDRPTPGTRPALVVAAMMAFSLGAGACGGSAPLAAPAAPAPTEAAPATTQAPSASAASSGVVVSASEIALGSILVGEGGMTLHGFTNDTGGASVCTGTCAEAWPPVIVGADWTVAPGLDSGIFNTTTRDDGSLQLVAGKWPLYYYGGDVAPGDVNGQGSGDVWFVAGTDGGLIQDEVAAASPGAGTADASVGAMTVGAVDGRDVLVDSSGMSLYGFLKDDAGEPTCTDGCANAWPPLLVDSADLPAGLDAEIFSVVAAGDGFQLKAGKWPLYRFAGDAEPGQGNGQGSGGEWFLVAPDGSLVRDDAGAEASSSDDGY